MASLQVEPKTIMTAISNLINRHFTSFHHEPDDPRQVEEERLENEEDGDPLVVGVVHRVVGHLAASAQALEVWRDVEGAVHPAIRF
jgi:hypothetical protein